MNKSDGLVRKRVNTARRRYKKRSVDSAGMLFVQRNSPLARYARFTDAASRSTGVDLWQFDGPMGIVARAGIIAFGAISVSKIDDILIPNWRPLGARVPPSLMAVPLALVAAYVAHRTAHPKIRDVCATFGFGLLAGNLQRAIARKMA